MMNEASQYHVRERIVLQTKPSETFVVIGNFYKDFPFRKTYEHETSYYLKMMVLLIDVATIFY